MGYKTYIDLITPLIAKKEVVSTGMLGEMQRCQLAIDRALAGDRVALVSSGDVGIYGMAGLVLEICRERALRPGPLAAAAAVDLPLEIIPGVPALAAAAALLGAPLMHDFAVISLSDLLTPWEVIQQRVSAAAAADFVMVIYNPKSKKRDWQLTAVRDLILSQRPPDTPVGIVTKAMRPGQTVVVTTLAEMLRYPIDMQTIVLVGNSQTYVYGDYLITPRGYLAKYAVAPGQAEIEEKEEIDI